MTQVDVMMIYSCASLPEVEGKRNEGTVNLQKFLGLTEITELTCPKFYLSLNIEQCTKTCFKHNSILLFKFMPQRKPGHSLEWDIPRDCHS